MTPASLTVSDVRARLEVLEQRVLAAGGSLERTRILPVTKTFPASVVRVALEAGLVDFGENYGQELEAKAAELADEDIQWHFIGGLQRNKVKRLAGTVSLWQTVDRAALVDEIAKRDQNGAILVQVNTTSEDQKSGVAPDEAAALVDRATSLGLSVQGLMTIGPTDGSDPRPAFAQLRALADDLRLPECSMGMSGDLEAAVAEGSTMVRIGTALFGSRKSQER